MQFKKLHQRQKSKYYNYIYFFAHSVLLLNYPSLFGGPFFKNLYLNLKKNKKIKKEIIWYIYLYFFCVFLIFFLVGLIHSPSSWSSHSHMLLISIISFFLCGFWKKSFSSEVKQKLNIHSYTKLLWNDQLTFLACRVKKA